VTSTFSSALCAAGLVAATLLYGPTPSQAQDELFEEDFEDAILCNWSSATEGQEGCVSCVGKPDGTACSPTVITQCGGCLFDTACDEVTDRECTCVTYACSAGACRATSETCIQQCTRNTDGATCGGTGCPGGPGFRLLCCNAGACSQICSECQGAASLQALGESGELRFGGLRCVAAGPGSNSGLAALFGSLGAGPGYR
jgi:hypothetical protein